MFYQINSLTHILDVSFRQMRALFVSRNVATLQQLNGGDILLDVCIVELVYLKRYLAYYQDCVRGGDYIMPSSMSEAMSTRTRSVNILSQLMYLGYLPNSVKGSERWMVKYVLFVIYFVEILV